MADTVTSAGGRAPGRPRRKGVSASVLAATVDLVGSQGYAHTSIDDIARRAGVAKTTVYRRWHSKGELAVDALVTELGEPPIPGAADEAAVGDVIDWLVSRVRRPVVRGLLVGLVAEAGYDTEVRRLLRGRIREPFTARLSLASGLPAATVDLTFDVVVGALLHRLAMTGRITGRDTAAVAAVAAGLLGASRDPDSLIADN